MMTGATLQVPAFPLPGAILFPRGQLPLHIFEPRYRAMIKDATAANHLIAMVQPREGGDRPALFDIGCLGRIEACTEMPDGRFNIVLEGLTRFRIAGEPSVATPYRQLEIDCAAFARDEGECEPLASIQRAALEQEARRYADMLGYGVDWNAVSRIDDEMLVNGIAQLAPLDVGSKQALLEAETLPMRADLLVQFMQFQRLAPGGGERAETLQ